MEGMPSERTGIPVAGDIIAGKYRIEDVIGQGGMGAVFSAQNTLTGRWVAIKWLLPEHETDLTRERLLREAQLAASVEHPNVVDIYDVGEHQGGLFLVMEYLRGRPLSDLMIERGRYDAADLIATLVPAMRGVHAAHLAGVIHRDLKPENIIVTEVDGELVPKVLDFGVSKSVGARAIPNASLTRTGALVGTPHYMALEQIDGSSIVDPRTDIYAFGVMLYRGLTGTYPFDGSTLGEVILKIGTREARSMRISRRDLPEELDAVVLRALSRDLNHRYASLEEFARALLPFVPSSHKSRASWLNSRQGDKPWLDARSEQRMIAQDDETSTSLPDVPTLQKARLRRRVWVGALVATLALAGGVWFAHGRGLFALGKLAASAERAEPHVGESANASDRGQTSPAPSTPRPSRPPEQVPLGETHVDIEQNAVPEALGVQPSKGAAAVKPARATPAPRGGARPAVIPGRRTNGLSVDDF
jgi:eukaryotic-like serine/threonine-protein kinase